MAPQYVFAGFARAAYCFEISIMNQIAQPPRARYPAILLALMLGCGGGANAAEANGTKVFQQEIQPLLAKYCYDCHGDGMNKGSLSLDRFKSDADLLSSHDLWLHVLKNLRANLMPPDKKPRPTDTERERIEQWIKTDVFQIDPKNPDPGRVTVRRLNRIEYRNTIQDLMGIDFNAEVEFPPDDSGFGFDNVGDALTLSPLHLEKFITAASEIVSRAVPTVSRVIKTNILSGADFDSASGPATGERMSFYKEATVSSKFTAKQPGRYRITVETGVRGNFDFDPGRCRVVFQIDDQEHFAEEYGWGESRKSDNPRVEHRYEVKWQPGEHVLSFALTPLVSTDKKVNSLDLRVTSVQIEGPLDREHWVKPYNYERFFPRDFPPETGTERAAYAREILQRFVTRAFRRPVDDRMLTRLVDLAQAAYGEPGQTFEAGVARAMVGVLASPRFLFRTEGPGLKRPGETYPLVDEYALASRLSYFFWSTMPDDELLRLAERGALRENLPAQVSRLLADRRSEALVRHFTGQWLQARDVESVSINARVVLGINMSRYPNGQRVEFDGELRRSMRGETEAVFAHIMREDRSVLELLDSDYTFLNSRLARHYGIEGVTGSEMRKVTLPKDSPRGGLLTQGTMLTVTSNPTRTSPVKRGLYILDNILGTPTPPPPPNVPDLEESKKDITDHEPTVRELMELHRSKPLCHSCHSRMDPLGMALENFNALGTWRDKEGEAPIDASGKLITGEPFKDVRDLKVTLKEKHRLDFYRCLTEKLMIYALGRGLEYYDTQAMDQIVARLDQHDGHFSHLLLGIIESAPFQKQREAAKIASASPTGNPAETKLQSAPGSAIVQGKTP
jgi:hypothetical protein